MLPIVIIVLLCYKLNGPHKTPDLVEAVLLAGRQLLPLMQSN